MSASQVLKIKIVSCGGMIDLMSEQEAMFLTNSLGLFRNVEDLGRRTPRANVSLIRAYNATDFYGSVAGGIDLLHLIAHADESKLQTGNGKRDVTAESLEKHGKKGLVFPEIVVSTACNFQSDAWRKGLKAVGVRSVIGSDRPVTPANLAAFNMAFYSALLSQIRKGKSNLERVEESFKLANAYYKSVHAKGATYAPFSLHTL